MNRTSWAVFLAIAAMLAPAAATFASGTAPRPAAEAPPRLASARPSPAPATVRPATPAAVPGLIGDSAGTPVERMADSIAEYYASGKLRLY
ncbi:MAG: hypothetical protein ACM3NF_08750 [Gemmatimonadota bacterium]